MAWGLGIRNPVLLFYQTRALLLQLRKIFVTLFFTKMFVFMLTVLPGPDNFTAITTSENGKSVQLSWNEMRDNETTGFHVYWCLKKKKVCKVDEIHWKNLSSNSTSTIIQLPNDYDQYLFAVSREAGDTSSGLVWSDCTYQIHKCKF